MAAAGGLSGYLIFAPNPEQAFYRSEVDRVFGARIIERQEHDGYALYVVKG